MTNSLTLVPNKCERIFEDLASYAFDLLNSIDAIALKGIIPYHLNNLVFKAQCQDLILVFTFTRTRFGKSLNYTADDILSYYKKLAITVGHKDSIKVYHVNYRRYKGEIVPLKMDMKRIVAIDDLHNTFPTLTLDAIAQALDGKALAVNPSDKHQNYPTSFIVK